MRKLGCVAGLLLTLALASPLAAAAEAGDTVRAKAPLAFHGLTELAGEGLAVRHAADGEAFAWTLVAPSATLTRWTCSNTFFSQSSCSAGDTLALRNVTFTLDPAGDAQVADVLAPDGGVAQAADGVVDAASFEGGMPAFVRSPLGDAGLAFTGAAGRIVTSLGGDLQAAVYGGHLTYEGETADGKPASGVWTARPERTSMYQPFPDDGFLLLEAESALLSSDGPGFAAAGEPTVTAQSGATFALVDGARTFPGPLAIEVLSFEKKDRATWVEVAFVTPGVLAPLAGPPPASTSDRLMQAGAVAAAVAGVAAVGAAAWYAPYLRYAGSLLVLPLYSRISRGSVMEHETRERIYAMIQESPGIHAHEISAKAGVGWGTAVYHLKMLEDHRLVVGERQGRYKRFFPAAGYTGTKDAIGALRNSTTAAVAEFIAARPGAIQREVCAALAISPSLVSWHIEKLERAELVKKVREGRTVRYYAGPMWNAVQPQAAPEPLAANN